MKISHIWHNDDGEEMAWGEPSHRDYEACRKAGDKDENVLEYSSLPRGWTYAEDEDDTDDGGNPGRYLVRE